MTSDFSNHQGSSPGVADPELEQLLCTTYEAPPVPRSLLKRIDRAVESEWGVSPQVAAGHWRRLGRRLRRSGRWTRVASAAAMAAAVVLAVVLSVRPGYAWSSVLAALAERGVVQIEGPDGVRWLSLAEGMLGERTTTSYRLLDVRQKVLLVRERGEAQVRRRDVETSLSASDPSRLLATFLLSDSLEQVDSEELAGLRIVDERWERGGDPRRDEVVLRVRFETAAKQRFALQLALNPHSHLPVACETIEEAGQASPLALSYPSIAAAELRRRDFPAELTAVAVEDSSSAAASLAGQEHNAATAEATASERTSKATGDNASTEQDSAAESVASSALLLKAASKWAPVEVRDRSQDEVRQRLDTLLAELWKEKGIEPAAPADDEELLRRVYLDLAGRTPTVTEVRAWLNDRSENRYERLVDRLLASRDHASHMATVWRTFLIPEGVDLTAFGGVEAFDRWLAERFAANERYDEVVRGLLLAEGRLSRSGPLLFYSAVKLDPDQLAARTARVFLGMRLECAQCHDHPFEPWTQKDFWGLAAFFAQISRPQAELESVSTVMRVRDVNRGEVMLPETETVIAPKFLSGTLPAENAQESARREQLARWLTSPENPYFARATANRIWGHLFGKGIVDPVDDFGEQNPPKSPELLDLLAGHFISTDFDLRELFRTVALSRAYRLSSSAETADERRTEWFAQMNVKMLTAEQMYDCITVATLLEPAPGAGPSEFQVARFGNNDRAVFLQQFRTPPGRSTEYQGGIPQALTLMNGSLIQDATGLSGSGLLNSLEAPFFTNRQRIEVLYLATLSRRPRASEWEVLESYIPADASGAELKESLADILWALLNSAEFTLNH